MTETTEAVKPTAPTKVDHLIPIADMKHHPIVEELVKVACTRASNNNPLFFRVHVSYYMSVLAAMMHTQTSTQVFKTVPINMYAINLATSGAGKGLTTEMMEQEVINQFRTTFLNSTLPMVVDRNLPVIANERAIKKQCDPGEELERVTKEYNSHGPLLFVFAEATLAALRQTRQQLLMAKAGSTNFQMDELGDNLMSGAECFSAYLELYDKGRLKSALRKNTNDSKRSEDIEGAVPANMMLFGTPSRLFAGDKVEDEFHKMLASGYARRCFFGFSVDHKKRSDERTPEEIYQDSLNSHDDVYLQKISDRFARLADPVNMHKTLPFTMEAELALIQYKLRCEGLSEEMPEHEEQMKAEMMHRYFKVKKLAGTYAFIDGDSEVKKEHLFAAIKLAEESGEAFVKLLNRDKPWVKLAKYMAAVKRNITHPDLMEDLPFYKGSISARQDMLNMAIAYGYQNNILIKKSFVDGIEFIRGETLEETNLDQMVVSYSKEMAYNYRNDHAPFEDLHKLTQVNGLHWTNHHMEGGHRCEDASMAGFNMIVIDVDGGINIDIARDLLKDYKALFYTTKSHKPDEHRFRIVLPTNYVLKLDGPDFKEFMKNVFDWLPFEVDDQTGQRSRKWASHNGQYQYQDGQLLDVLPFIPKTSKNESRKALLNDQASMDNLERWVINNTGDGNRNNQLLRYALILVDAGFELDKIMSKVNALNDKLPDKLPEAEVLSTIMKTVTKQISKRAT